MTIGSSAGSISAAIAAFRPEALPTIPPGGLFPTPLTITNNPDVQGIALTSAITTGGVVTLHNAWPTYIRRPVLFVHHVNDGCINAKYRNASQLAFDMMAASVRVSFTEIVGTPVGPADPADPDPTINPDPCGAPGTAGYLLHAFSGSGTAALDAIQKWIATVKR